MQIEIQGLTQGARKNQLQNSLNFVNRKQQPQLGINSIFVHFHIAEFKIRQE
jgi:hypothetical protein